MKHGQGPRAVQFVTSLSGLGKSLKRPTLAPRGPTCANDCASPWTTPGAIIFVWPEKLPWNEHQSIILRPPIGANFRARKMFTSIALTDALLRLYRFGVTLIGESIQLLQLRALLET
jgi:hypothetical protein